MLLKIKIKADGFHRYPDALILDSDGQLHMHFEGSEIFDSKQELIGPVSEVKHIQETTTQEVIDDFEATILHDPSWTQ